MKSWQILAEFRFRAFDGALRALGWRRDADALPADPDEPAFASWSQEPDGQLEYVYNRALGLRALAVRGEDVEKYLEELRSVVPLAPSSLTLDQWERAEPMDARAPALAAAEIIRAQVMPLLLALRDDPAGEMARRLAPRPKDYALVFVADSATAAREAYERLWSDAAKLWRRPGPRQRDVLCYVAPAGMLAYENDLSRPFPGGYRAVAPLLKPSRVWVAWKYVAPGKSSGLAFNGLVWVDDHWAWFPKPYRALRDFAKRHPGRGG